MSGPKSNTGADFERDLERLFETEEEPEGEDEGACDEPE
jgi:hypothetical protein